jgi:uncharacterized delta-60 repeat protein
MPALFLPRALRGSLVAALVAALVSFVTPVALATPGDLDSTFGSAGWVTTDFESSAETAAAMALQSDGKIVAAGWTTSDGSDYDFALARYTSAGALDSTFGSGGKVRTDFGPDNDAVHGVAIQTDGKIVVAGTDGYDWALARYTVAGALDTTFGSGGKVVTSFNEFRESANAVAIQPDGKIVAAGFTFDGGTFPFALARYTPTGTLDTTFGSGGKVTTSFGSTLEADDEAEALAIQSDGKIVAVGSSFQNGSSENDFAVARYTPSGQLDTTFGGDGTVTTAIGLLTDNAEAVALQSDGKIVVAGLSRIPPRGYDFALARYTTGGALDSAFGTGGKVATDFGSAYDEAFATAVQADGKIVAAGFDYTGSVQQFGLARYTAAGVLDPSFGAGGKVSALFGLSAHAEAMVIQPDGRIAATGATYNGSDDDFALARFLGDPVNVTTDVSIVSSPSPGAFSPASATVAPGGSVKWTNTTAITHTSTGDAPLSFWDSGNLTQNQTFTKAFAAAGAYAYHCNIHSSMHGTIKVNPKASPTTGTTATTFTITWASASIPSGYAADLIIKRPGANWAVWMTNRTGAQISATFTPDAGAGTYLFAARLRKVAAGSPASGWAGTGISVS